MLEPFFNPSICTLLCAPAVKQSPRPSSDASRRRPQIVQLVGVVLHHTAKHGVAKIIQLVFLADGPRASTTSRTRWWRASSCSRELAGDHGEGRSRSCGVVRRR